MKTKSALLIALALGVTTISAKAGLITDPLSFQEPILDEGLTTDPLGSGGPKHVRLPSANVPAASSWLAEIVADLPADGSLRLRDLFLNPEFFAAAHAAGPAADALRGQIDWLMLSGVILGLDGDDGLDDFDGMDGSDDLTGDAGDDVLNWSWGASNPAIILGGPGNDTLAPFNPAIILGGPGNDTIILGGPGNDTAQPQINASIILGGPGSNNIILGGDYLKAPINGFVFGTTSHFTDKPLAPAFSDGTTQIVNRLSDVLISDLVPSLTR